ncbi:MAG: TetR/AcrR family transcriptional regulator [Sedimentitalea sp.]
MAAIDCISKRGFAQTTLRHVTEKAKLSHGVVNYHFDSKEALYDATLGFLAAEHYATWTHYLSAAGPTAPQRLEAIIRADFDKKICTRKRLAVWFAFWGQAKYRPNYLKIHNSFDNERYSEIVRICEEIIPAGDTKDKDVAQAARIIESLVDGAWLCLMLYPEIADRKVSRDDCLHTLAMLFPDHFPAQSAS